MPIKVDNKSVALIKYDNKDIFRVFKGTDLVWGLFNCYFKMVSSAGNIQSGGSGSSINDTNNPSTFVWGDGISSLKNPTTPDNVTFVKWCSDPKCNTAANDIGKDIKVDTTRYGKVYIQATQYRMYYKEYKIIGYQ